MPVSSLNSLSSGWKLCWYGCGVCRMLSFAPCAFFQSKAPETSFAPLVAAWVPPPVPTQADSSGDAANAVPPRPSIFSTSRRVAPDCRGFCWSISSLLEVSRAGVCPNASSEGGPPRKEVTSAVGEPVSPSRELWSQLLMTCPCEPHGANLTHLVWSTQDFITGFFRSAAEGASAGRGAEACGLHRRVVPTGDEELDAVAAELTDEALVGSGIDDHEVEVGERGEPMQAALGELAVIDEQHGPRGGLHECALDHDGVLRLVVARSFRDGRGRHEQQVRVQRPDRLDGLRPEERIVGGVVGASERDEVDIRLPRKLIHRSEEVCHHRERAARREPRGELERGRAVVEEHRHTGLYQVRGRLGDLRLGRDHGVHAVPHVTVVEIGRYGSGAAADPPQPALPFQRVKITVDGHLADLVLLGERLDAREARRGDLLPDPLASLTDRGGLGRADRLRLPAGVFHHRLAPFAADDPDAPPERWRVPCKSNRLMPSRR